MRKSRRKFKPGRQYKNPMLAIRDILAGKSVYFHHKYTHYGWAMSWPLVCIRGYVRSGSLYRVIPIKKDAP